MIPLRRKRKMLERGIPRERQRYEEAIAEAVLAWYDGGPGPVVGGPCRCPTCGRYGMVERAEPVAGRYRYLCNHCQAGWTLTYRAVGMALARRLAA